MSLQSIARSALTSILTAMPETAVTVTSNGATATGFDDTNLQASQLTTMGERGAKTGSLRVSAAAFPEPAPGATILVNTAHAFVTSVRTDSAHAFWLITYSLQRPIPEGPGV